MSIPLPSVLLFDWGDTLMSEEGPQDITMADWPEVRAVDGARSVLAALALHFKLGVATNATISKHSDIRRALERTGLADFISDIFCYTDIQSRKDDPRFWHHVLTSLRVFPEEIVMIGDSFEQDVLGPRKAGISSIWFNWKQEPLRERDGVVINQLAELLPMFLKEPNRSPEPTSGLRATVARLNVRQDFA